MQMKYMIFNRIYIYAIYRTNKWYTHTVLIYFSHWLK